MFGDDYGNWLLSGMLFATNTSWKSELRVICCDTKPAARSVPEGDPSRGHPTPEMLRAYTGGWDGCGSIPMIPFWDRCATHFRTYFRGDWDVHWGYGILTHSHMAISFPSAVGGQSTRVPHEHSEAPNPGRRFHKWMIGFVGSKAVHSCVLFIFALW